MCVDTQPTQAGYKQQAAETAVELIAAGMVVGLGVGSTAIFAVRRIAELVREGQLTNILAVPCSHQVEHEARRLGIPLTSLEKHPVIDVTIDGADEVGPDLVLIKGGGGALFREKIVAQASQREVIVVDEAKISPVVGTRWALPVEVHPFGWRTQQRFISELGATVRLRIRNDGSPLLTDQGNMILDCAFGPIYDPETLAIRLGSRAGIIAHGLFIDLATDLIVAGAAGVRHQRKSG